MGDEKMDYEKRIQEVLQFIDRNLDDEISLETLASHVFCSKFHFHRIFEAYVGQTVMEFIKTKRLIRAVNQLTHSDRSILDIGLEAGFEYQQSFTRAFRNRFGFTPSVCRRKKKMVEMMEKTSRLGYAVKNNRPDSVFGPEFLYLEEINVIGIEGFTRLDKESPREATSVVPVLWEHLFKRMEEIRSIEKEGLFYAICTSDWSMEDNIGYMAAVPVKKISGIPPRMIGRTIPKGKYARFQYKGVGDQLLEALDYIFGAWLLLSQTELSEEMDMAIRFENYDGNDPNAVCEILVPVKEPKE